ncbi:MAG TPA: glycosyltransferase family 4 protein [Chloroflexota bacterium]|nr:glycosyltransferase family 4 protein [Chloroflexota bacterium]
MRVLMLSKACVVGAYQRKLEELARQPGVELTCLVPPYWRQDGTPIPLERAHVQGYRLAVTPLRFNGHFHLFYFRGLAAWLARTRPDIVHIDEEPYNLATGLAMRLAVRQGARRLFFTWQNLFRRYPPPFSLWEQYAFRRTHYALAGNREAVQVLRRKGYRGPVAVIPQFGVDPAVFYPRPRPPRAAFVIGYAGRLVEEKGLLLLLEAVARLRGAWCLQLVGSGPLQPALVRRAQQLGIAERVDLRPHVPSSAMPEIVAGWDVLALPSLTRPNWKEQFGRILIEAMASGVPCVGSDSGEIPHVLGEAGLVVPEGAVDALHAALARLQEEPTLRRELAERGRARVLAHFTHTRIAEQTYAVYRAVLAA